MKNNFDKFLKYFIIIIFILMIIFFRKGFNNTYVLLYDENSKGEINNFISNKKIVFQNKKKIIKVVMIKGFPNGYFYQIYYKDSNNKNKYKEISSESDSIMKEYVLEHGQDLSAKYINNSKICLYILIFTIIFIGLKNLLKDVLLRKKNSK